MTRNPVASVRPRPEHPYTAPPGRTLPPKVRVPEVRVRRIRNPDGTFYRPPEPEGGRLEIERQTWHWASCAICHQADATHALQTPVLTATTPAQASILVYYVCNACGAARLHLAPAESRLTDLAGPHRKARVACWVDSVCQRCCRQPATHWLTLYAPDVPYPWVAFVCDACLSPDEVALPPSRCTIPYTAPEVRANG